MVPWVMSPEAPTPIHRTGAHDAMTNVRLRVAIAAANTAGTPRSFQAKSIRLGLAGLRPSSLEREAVQAPPTPLSASRNRSDRGLCPGDVCALTATGPIEQINVASDCIFFTTVTLPCGLLTGG